MIFKFKKENILIVGYGEIGKSIFKLYNSKKYNVYVKDIEDCSLTVDNIDVMNINPIQYQRVFPARKDLQQKIALYKEIAGKSHGR